jgi:hypothetical protein
MTSRSIALFTHVVGVLALFVALAIEWLSLALVRTAHPKVPMLVIGVLRAIPKLTGTAGGLIVLSGIYLAAEVGVLGLAWVRVAVGAMVLMAILGGIALRQVLRIVNDRDGGSIDVTELRRRASRPFVRVSLGMRLAVATALIYLMIAKPGFLESALLIGLALITGAAATMRRRRSPVGAAGVDDRDGSVARPV